MNYSIKVLEEKLRECERNLAWYTGKSCQLFPKEKEKRIQKLNEQIPDIKNAIGYLKILEEVKVDIKEVNSEKECRDKKDFCKTGSFHIIEPNGKCSNCGMTHKEIVE